MYGCEFMVKNQNWTGDFNSIFKTLGASNHTDDEREANDYYATDPKTIIDLFNVEDFDVMIWECACGEGHLSKKMIELGKQVLSTDLIDRGFGQGIVDFLQYEGEWEGDIITNPPYKFAKEFVEKALSVIKEGHKVAMFLKVQFLEGQKRYELFKKYPPKYVYVFSKRQRCCKNGDFESYGSSAVAYAWFVWVKNFSGETTLRWIE